MTRAVSLKELRNNQGNLDQLQWGNQIHQKMFQQVIVKEVKEQVGNASAATLDIAEEAVEELSDTVTMCGQEEVRSLVYHSREHIILN